MPCCAAKSGSSSVFTLTTTQRRAPACATFTSSGATILHGPHHGTQKSTSTGSALRPVSAENEVASGISTGAVRVTTRDHMLSKPDDDDPP